MKPYKEYIKSANQREIEITSAERIQKWIDERMKDNDYGKVFFSVLVLDPAYENQVVELIKRNYPKYKTCDTKAGCWCLNDDWYEFYADAITEWGGVYPVHWNIADVVFLEELYLRRKIYIDAAWVTDDGLKPIH